MKRSASKKRRTREHVISDLSINYVERRILLRGYSAERVRHDYGYDLIVATYNEKGEAENGQIYIQVKATDRPTYRNGGQDLAIRVNRRDLRLWLWETYPVLLVVYDGKTDRAYWLYVQSYFEDHPKSTLFAAESFVVQVPTRQRLSVRAMSKFAVFKQRVFEQMEGRIRHHD